MYSTQINHVGSEKVMAFLTRLALVPGIWGSALLLAVSVALLPQAVSAQTLYWDTNGATAGSGGPSPSGTWDGVAPNWSTSSAGTVATGVWTNGDTAVFSADSDATNSYTVTISGTQTAGGVTFATGTNTLTGGTLQLTGGGAITVNASPVKGVIASPITGSVGLTKLSSGELVLQGANTFTGNLTNRNGTITLDNNQAPSTGLIVINPNGPAALHVAQPSITITNNVFLQGSSSSIEMDANSGSTFTLSGVISGPHNWNVNGPGTLVLSATNTFLGSLNILQGTVVAESDSAMGSTGNGTIVSSNATLAFEGGFTYSVNEQVTLSGPGVGGGAALNNISGDNIFDGTVILATNSLIGATAGSLVLGLPISGSGYNITKVGSGQVDLTGSPNNYNNTLISLGTLGVDYPANVGNGTVTISSGATLTGNGSAPGGVVVSGTILPDGGSVPDTLDTGDEQWNGGGAYTWEINDAAGTVGLNDGWSLLNLTDGLTVNATTGSKFTIHITSLDLNTGLPDPAANFDNTQVYYWTIATSATGITGFDPSKFTIDASGFQNAMGNGAFIIQQSGNSIVLAFVQKPQVTVSPTPYTTNECDNVTFTATATGTPTLTYQWFFGSSPIAGATLSTYSTNNLNPASAGSYSVVVSNLSYYTATSTATLYVLSPPPTVVTHPITVDLNPTSYTLTSADIAAILAGSSDDCGITATNVSPTTFTCANVGPNAVTLILTDAHGRSATNTAIVTVDDTNPPVVVFHSINVQLGTNGSYTLTPADIATISAGSSDNCGILTSSVSPGTLTFCDVGTKTVTLTVTDLHGNSTSTNANLTVLAPTNVPPVVYVDASYGNTCHAVSFPNVGGTGTYYVGFNAFAKIQDGIEALPVNYGTVNVAAGTYVEDVTIDRPMSLLGPNAGINPNTGSRVPEAVIRPATSGPDPFGTNTFEVVVYVAANNVTIQGFTVDGDNTNHTSGIELRGADLDAGEGISSYQGVGSITVANNIIRNTSYTGMDFWNYDNGGGATSTNHFNNNEFQNIGYVPYGGGSAVFIYDNFYADVSGNVMTDVRNGVQTGFFTAANPGATQDINNNQITCTSIGISHNLQRSAASTFTISNNVIAFEYETNAPEWMACDFVHPRQRGHQHCQQLHHRHDHERGDLGYATVGYNVWGSPTTPGVTINGGSVSNANYGAWVNNWDGYFSPGGSTMMTINGSALPARRRLACMCRMIPAPRMAPSSAPSSPTIRPFITAAKASWCRALMPRLRF